MPRKNKPFQLRKGAVPSARNSKENAVIWAGPTVGLEEMIEMQTIAYHKNCKITTAQFIGQDGTKGGTLVLQFEEKTGIEKLRAVTYEKGMASKPQDYKEAAVIWAGPPESYGGLMETQAVAYHQDCVMSRHRFFVAPEGTKGGTFIMEIRDKTEDDVTSQAGDWEEAETAIASAAGDDDWIICTLEDMERDEELLSSKMSSARC